MDARVSFASIISLVLIVCPIPQTSGFERDMTFPIEAQKEECFYENALEGQVLEVDYQVIDSGPGGTYAIDFSIVRPDGVPIVGEHDKADSTHQIEVQVPGDYKICFDNTRTRYGQKLIFFELIVEGGENEEEDVFETFPDTDEERVEDMEEALKIIRERMTKTIRLQGELRAHEFKDRSIAEHNFERVNFWSVVQVVIMVIAGVTQVVMIRSIFDEKSPVRKIFT